MRISVVINSFNESAVLARCLGSIKNLAGEIVLIDMGSSDGTVEIAKKFDAKIYHHKKLDYVEPARNFGISKASNDWILIMDPDEEIPPTLVKELKIIVKNPKADYYRIPRKNIIFGRWIDHSKWWPDYNIRFFKKGKVSWNEVIHSVPFTNGKGLDLDPKVEFAIVHNNYKNLDEYFEKMYRYSKVQSKNLVDNNYKFVWSDIISKPVNEFLSRYFAGEGYKDGVHGLILSLLQAFSELTVYLRVWEAQGQKEEMLNKREIKSVLEKNIKDTKWWIRKVFLWFPFQR